MQHRRAVRFSFCGGTLSVALALAIPSAMLAQLTPGTDANAAQPVCTIETFDPPGSISSNPTAINSLRAIVGSYYTSDGQVHGFLRAPDGTFTEIQIPISNVIDVLLFGIDMNGAIAGNYYDEFATHAFLRAPDGTTTAIEVPGFPTTFVSASSPNGMLTGYNMNEDNIPEHCFVRGSDGAYTTFDDPIWGLCEARAINSNGEVAGQFGKGARAFIRKRDGSITTFDASGRSAGTQPFGISMDGTISGVTWLQGSPVGFTRSPDGTITTWRVSGGPTTPISMNPEGAVTGWFVDEKNRNHGFLKASNGAITKFNFPGTIGGTLGRAITSHGTITGSYQISSGYSHGFVRICP